MNFRDFREKVEHGSHRTPIDYYYFDLESEHRHVTYHWHPEWEIIHVIEGTLPIVINDHNITIPPNTFYLLKPGYLHGLQWDNCVFESIVWDNERLTKSFPLLENTSGMNTSSEFLSKTVKPELSAHPKLCEICTELFFYYHKNTFNQYCIIGCLYRLLGTVIEEEYYEKTTAKDAFYYKLEKNIKAVLTYIEKNYSEPLTLYNLSSVAGLNHKYFCKVFKSVTLYTPMEYLNRYRIDIARHILATDDSISISDVAEQCGFCDTGYFIRIFKRYIGTTPKQFHITHSRTYHKPQNH